MNINDLIKEALDDIDEYISEKQALQKYPFTKTQLDKFAMDGRLQPMRDTNGNPLYIKAELDELIDNAELDVESDFLTAAEVISEFDIDQNMLDQMVRAEIVSPERPDGGGEFLYRKSDIQNFYNDVLTAAQGGM